MCSKVGKYADLEDYHEHLDECIKREYDSPTEEDCERLEPILDQFLAMDKITQIQVRKMLSPLNTDKYYKNSFLLRAFYIMRQEEIYNHKQERHIQELLRVKRGKSHSGVVVITVFTSPYPSYIEDDGTIKTQAYSCRFDCHYCPNMPTQPRSYLLGEPGVMRANQYEFDPCRQMWGRLETLHNIGHNIGKIEAIVLGGTWASYPIKYREQFIRDLYYAANTFWDRPSERRKQLSLKEEIDINRDTRCRIISVTLETRPDCINRKEVQLFRSYGSTRIQLGVQSIYDDVLKSINRQCTVDRVKKGLKILKDCCFKCDVHIMPGLPFVTPERDREMLIDRLYGLKSPTIVEQRGDISWELWDVAEPDLVHDQVKLYPCETVPYTEIEKWYKEGKYKPYAEELMTQLLYDTMLAIYPWVRTNRIVRDISSPYIIASANQPNTGQIVLDTLKKNKQHSMCIRFREVKEKDWDGNYITVVRQYESSGGTEYFISAESKDKHTIYGFVRLRLTTPNTEIFPELEGCALIRELHVYGKLNEVDDDRISNVQHKGIGKHLMSVAEGIAVQNGYKNIAVISGVGVQRYYEKIGFTRDSEGVGDFMIKYI